MSADAMSADTSIITGADLHACIVPRGADGDQAAEAEEAGPSASSSAQIPRVRSLASCRITDAGTGVATRVMEDEVRDDDLVCVLWIPVSEVLDPDLIDGIRVPAVVLHVRTPPAWPGGGKSLQGAGDMSYHCSLVCFIGKQIRAIEPHTANGGV